MIATDEIIEIQGGRYRLAFTCQCDGSKWPHKRINDLLTMGKSCDGCYLFPWAVLVCAEEAASL